MSDAFTEKNTELFRFPVTFVSGFGVLADQTWSVGSPTTTGSFLDAYNQFRPYGGISGFASSEDIPNISSLVKTTGTQTITGLKTFQTPIIVLTGTSLTNQNATSRHLYLHNNHIGINGYLNEDGASIDRLNLILANNESGKKASLITYVNGVPLYNAGADFTSGHLFISTNFPSPNTTISTSLDWGNRWLSGNWTTNTIPTQSGHIINYGQLGNTGRFLQNEILSLSGSLNDSGSLLVSKTGGDGTHTINSDNGVLSGNWTLRTGSVTGSNSLVTVDVADNRYDIFWPIFSNVTATTASGATIQYAPFATTNFNNYISAVPNTHTWIKECVIYSQFTTLFSNDLAIYIAARNLSNIANPNNNEDDMGSISGINNVYTGSFGPFTITTSSNAIKATLVRPWQIPVGWQTHANSAGAWGFANIFLQNNTTGTLARINNFTAGWIRFGRTSGVSA